MVKKKVGDGTTYEMVIADILGIPVTVHRFNKPNDEHRDC